MSNMSTQFRTTLPNKNSPFCHIATKSGTTKKSPFQKRNQIDHNYIEMTVCHPPF